jgi:hypothetical protein
VGHGLDGFKLVRQVGIRWGSIIVDPTLICKALIMLIMARYAPPFQLLLNAVLSEGTNAQYKYTSYT